LFAAFILIIFRAGTTIVDSEHVPPYFERVALFGFRFACGYARNNSKFYKAARGSGTARASRDPASPGIFIRIITLFVLCNY